MQNYFVAIKRRADRAELVAAADVDPSAPAEAMVGTNECGSAFLTKSPAKTKACADAQQDAVVVALHEVAA